jgi:hypothetical protein
VWPARAGGAVAMIDIIVGIKVCSSLSLYESENFKTTEPLHHLNFFQSY